METKYKVGIVVVVLLTTFAAGRYSVPEKVKIETKIVEVEKKVVEDKKATHKTTKIITIQKPDGTKETDETDVEDTKTDDKTHDDTKTDSDVVKEVIKGSDKVTISALLGVDLRLGTPIYGGAITKPILGPITLGIFGLSNASIGGSVGLTF